MDYRIKFGLVYIGGQLIAIVLTLMLMATLAGFIGGGFWGVVFKIFTIILYLAIFYKLGKWQFHSDKAQVYDLEPALPRALKACILPYCLNILLAICTFIPSIAQPAQQVIRLWMLPYGGFFPADLYIYFFVPLLTGLLLPGAVLLGYYFGMLKISLTENFFPKKKKKK